MDKKLDTFTHITEEDYSKRIPLLETQGNIKPTLNKKSLILIGTWTCALIITSPLTSVHNYEISTSLNYPDKNTQTNIVYEPLMFDKNVLVDEEINNNVFVRTKPEKSYPVKLKIKKYNMGKPIIDEKNSYES